MGRRKEFSQSATVEDAKPADETVAHCLVRATPDSARPPEDFWSTALPGSRASVPSEQRGSRRVAAAEAREIPRTRPRSSSAPGAPAARLVSPRSRPVSFSDSFDPDPTRPNRRQPRLKLRVAFSRCPCVPSPPPRRRAASGPDSRNSSPLVARVVPSVSRYEIHPRPRRFRARARALKRGTPRGTDGTPHSARLRYRSGGAFGCAISPPEWKTPPFSRARARARRRRALPIRSPLPSPFRALPLASPPTHV